MMMMMIGGSLFMKCGAVSPSDRSVVTYFFEHPCEQRDHDK